MDEEKADAVRAGLLAWFAANGRDLPWRRTRDPYRIMVSEIMLQQTQVDRVIAYYHRFFERFPTLDDLADAPTADVIRSWAGLGYNRRAVNLQRAAQHIVHTLGGRFPDTVEGLRALPGIGAYTAGAIACFAFERDSAFIDTNMRRVLHRLFFGSDVPAPRRSDRDVLDLAATLVPPDEGWSWNQALIEFGALHCTARKPACVVCPLQAHCSAYPAVQSDLAVLPRGTRAKREPAFGGSNRFYRGRVIAALRNLPPSSGAHASPGDRHGIPLRALGPHVRDGFTDDDLPWLVGVVEGLRRDGLAAVAEDSPTYDPSSPSSPDAGEIRIRLP